MLRLLALDSGPLGLLTHPKPSPEAVDCARWLKGLLAAQVRVLLPAIVDYELRREYLLRHGLAALRKLDALRELVEFLALGQTATDVGDLRRLVPAALWRGIGIS